MEDEVPELDWSAQSPHIQSLFRPWQPGDGYDEETLLAAEARLLPGGARLPATLRSFYRAWGRQSDLTQMNEHLLAPEQWVIHSGALIFCVENQRCAYWALPVESPAADPPVVVAQAGPERAVWEVTADLDWRVSHPCVSLFLDALTYRHAFSGGALHGARSQRVRPVWWHVKWLEREWRETEAASLQVRDREASGWQGSPVYIRDGQAIEWCDRFWAVANRAEALDDIARVLEIDWEERW
jgi:hypothetical protein